MSLLARASRRLALLGILVMVPTGALTFLLFAALAPDELLTAVREPTNAVAGTGELLAPFGRVAFLALSAQAAGFIFVLCGAHLILRSELAGDPMTVVGAVRAAGRRYPAAVVAAIAAGSPLGVSAFVGVTQDNPALLALTSVAASWIAVSTSMTIPALTMESLAPLPAVRRSFALVRGRRLQTLAFLLVIGALGVVAILLIQLVAIPLVALGGQSPWLTATALAGVVFQGVLIAFLGAPVTAWYLDLRARSPFPRITDS